MKTSLVKQIAFSLTVLAGAATAGAGEVTCHEAFSAASIKTSEEAREMLEANAFKTNRDLTGYHEYLSERNGLVRRDPRTRKALNNTDYNDRGQLPSTLASLPKGSIWIDMGSGDGKALAQGLSENPNIEIGVGVCYARTGQIPKEYFPEGQRRTRFIDGDLLENMTAAGRLDPYMGKVNVITDLFGPISYSPHLRDVLKIYIDLLAPGGELFFTLSEMSARPKTFVRYPDGGVRALREWIDGIPGLRVVVSDSAGLPARYHIVKLTENVDLPDNMKLEKIDHGTPPYRVYQVESLYK